MESYFFVGGCAGSGSPDSENRKEFGVLTTALGIVAGSTGIFVDNGTGIRGVNRFLNEHRVVTVYGFQTHFHGDHRNGIWNNTALNSVEAVFAPRLGGKTFSQLLAEDFYPTTWPIAVKNFNIREFPAGEKFCLANVDGDVLVTTMAINHAGGAVAYKFCLPDGKSIVIATDCELAVEKDREKYAELISGVDLLYADIQYRDSEYDGTIGICGGPAMPRKGWGHSTPAMFVEALKLSKKTPKKILVGHHDIARTDGDLRCFWRELFKTLAPFDCEVAFAKEGDRVTIGNQ